MLIRSMLKIRKYLKSKEKKKLFQSKNNAKMKLKYKKSNRAIWTTQTRNL